MKSEVHSFWIRTTNRIDLWLTQNGKAVSIRAILIYCQEADLVGENTIETITRVARDIENKSKDSATQYNASMPSDLSGWLSKLSINPSLLVTWLVFYCYKLFQENPDLWEKYKKKAILRQTGKPKLYVQKTITLSLTSLQLNWLNSQRNISETIRKLIQAKVEITN